MSHNPYAFENYSPTPTTPNSAFPWDQEPQAQAQGFGGPSQQYQELPRAQPQPHAFSPPMMSGSLSAEPLSASTSGAERGQPSAAVEGIGPGVGGVFSSFQSAHQSLPSPPSAVPSHGGAAYGGTSSPSSSMLPSRPASAMSAPRRGGQAAAVGAYAQGTAGPIRVPRAYGVGESAHGVHPYRRPSTSGSARGGSVTPRLSPEAPVGAGRGRTREASAPPPPARSESSSAGGAGSTLRIIQYQPVPPTPAPVPATMEPLTVQCPAGGQRASSSRQPAPAPTSAHATAPSPLRTHFVSGASAVPEPASTGVSPLPLHLQALGARLRTGRFHLRADVHYDPTNRLWTAMLEVPGMKKEQIRLSLRACPYSRAKELIIRGRMSPVFPADAAGWTHRERKFGEFTRTLVVPAEARREDVLAYVEDGVLTIKIPVAPPAVHEEELDIQVR